MWFLLENVFEKLRETSLEHYGLDPAHFYTLPGFAWKACLKCMRIKLRLLTDPNKLLMFEKGIRRGITKAIHKHTSVNKKYVGDHYDLSQESNYPQYLDANNLYGWAMSQPRPVGGFK